LRRAKFSWFLGLLDPKYAGQNESVTNFKHEQASARAAGLIPTGALQNKRNLCTGKNLPTEIFYLKDDKVWNNLQRVAIMGEFEVASIGIDFLYL